MIGARQYTIFLFLLSSCTKPNFYQLQINDIPTKSPNYNAQIVFLGEKLQTDPYFEVIDFEIQVKGILNKKDIRKSMEIEAIKEGVDAIIEVEARTEITETRNIFTLLIDMMDEDYEATTIASNQTYIYGKGIMYLDNLDYIGTQPEYEYFYEINQKTGFPEPFFKIEYKLNGQVYNVYPESENALQIFKKNFQYYSDFHLLKQREFWAYKKKVDNVAKRILRNENGVVVKVCMPEYDKHDRIIRLKILNRIRGKFRKEFINYAYGEHSKLINRLVEAHDGIKIYEEYLYEDDRLSGRKILLNLPDGKQFQLNTSIHYFDPDYLRDMYFNEIAKQQLNH